MSNKRHHALESNAVRHFGTFYAERCAESGGTFEVDPKWGLQLYNPGAKTLPVIVKARPPGLAAGQQKLSLAAPSVNKADDGDLAEMSGTVSIIDPISLCRIETPVRGRQCTHLQVFDLQPYIEFNHMMERSRSKLSKLWNCPFCGQHVKERDLVKVGAFVKVLEAAKGNPALTHVDTLPDGSLALPGDGSPTVPGDAAEDEDVQSNLGGIDGVSGPCHGQEDEESNHMQEAKGARGTKRTRSRKGDPAPGGGLRRFFSSACVGNSSAQHTPTSQEQPKAEKARKAVAKSKSSACGRRRGRQPQRKNVQDEGVTQELPNAEPAKKAVAKSKSSACGRRRGRQPQRKNVQDGGVTQEPAKEAADEVETHHGQGDEKTTNTSKAGAKRRKGPPNPRRRGRRAMQACDDPAAEPAEPKETRAASQQQEAACDAPAAVPAELKEMRAASDQQEAAAVAACDDPAAEPAEPKEKRAASEQQAACDAPAAVPAELKETRAASEQQEAAMVTASTPLSSNSSEDLVQPQRSFNEALGSLETLSFVATKRRSQNRAAA